MRVTAFMEVPVRDERLVYMPGGCRANHSARGPAGAPGRRATLGNSRSTARLQDLVLLADVPIDDPVIINIDRSVVAEVAVEPAEQAARVG